MVLDTSDHKPIRETVSAFKIWHIWSLGLVFCGFGVTVAIIALVPGLVKLICIGPFALSIVLGSALIPAWWVRPSYEGMVMMTEEEEHEALEQNLPFDQYQVVGTHNSCHRPNLFAVAILPDWRYCHATLPEQLDAGIRHVELDVWFNRTLRRWEVWHECVDPITSAPWLFRDAISQIQKWSHQRPTHFPLIINIDVKGAYLMGLSLMYPLFGRGVAALNGKSFRVLEEEILSVFKVDELFKPKDLDHPRLRVLAPHTEDIARPSDLSFDWPLVKSLRGKILFQLNLYSDRSDCAAHADPFGVLWPRSDSLSHCLYAETRNAERAAFLRSRGYLVRSSVMSGVVKDRTLIDQYRAEGRVRADQLKDLGVQLLASNHPGWYPFSMISPIEKGQSRTVGCLAVMAVGDSNKLR